MHASDIRVAVAGEALIDLIQRSDGTFTPCHGGAVYNMARALSRQAVATSYLNPFSSDRFGQALADGLRADGALLARPDPVMQPTSLAVVGLDATGHPHYAFYREGVADRQVDADGLIAHCADLPQLHLVCTGGLALDPRDAGVVLPWLRTQRSRGVGVAIDVNMRPSVMPDLAAYRQHALQAMALADLVKVSDEDLGHLQCPGHTPLAQARSLFEGRAIRAIALTLGPAGAMLLTRQGHEVHWQDPQPVTVVDTVGAGDSFFAGLLAGLLARPETTEATFAQGLDGLTEAACLPLLKHAVASASLCVQESGCVPPTWSQAQARVAAALR